MPCFLSVVKDAGKHISGSDEHADLVFDCLLVPGVHYLVAKPPHVDNGEDNLRAGLKVANTLAAECLVKSLLQPAEFFFEKICFHRFTSFLVLWSLGKS